VSGLRFVLPWGVSALAGAVMSAALEPGAPAALGFAAPVLLLLALRGAHSVVHAQALAFVAGACFWSLHLHWVTALDGMNAANTLAGFGTLAVVFSSFGALIRLCEPAPVGWRWAVCGAAWVLADALRLHLGFASIPWGSLAYSQIEFAPLAQLASLAGIYGVGFVIVGFAAAVAEGSVLAWQRRWPRGSERLELALPALLLLVAITWGAARTEPPAAGELRVGFVQAGVYDPQEDPRSTRRGVLERYREQTLRAVEEGAQFVVWPASSVPGRIPFDSGLVRYLEMLAREAERPLLVGSSGEDKSQPGLRQQPTANSAFLIDASGEFVERYDKIRLLPFNEYLPLRGVIEWPLWAGGGIVDARAGERRTVFTAAGARIALLICWENFFPADFRESVMQEVDFVVSMTNEAFTGDRLALHQMLTMNRFRAIESGVPVVRVSTTGISAAIDRHGRLREALLQDGGRIDGHRVTSVPLGSAPTLYARLGDWFPVSCALGLGVLLFRRRFRGWPGS